MNTASQSIQNTPPERRTPSSEIASDFWPIRRSDASYTAPKPPWLTLKKRFRPTAGRLDFRLYYYWHMPRRWRSASRRRGTGRGEGRGGGLWHLSCYIEIARSTGGVGGVMLG